MAAPGRISAGRAGPAKSEILVATQVSAQTAAIRRDPSRIGLDVLRPEQAFCSNLRLERPTVRAGDRFLRTAIGSSLTESR
jgi:hypothetical protein